MSIACRKRHLPTGVALEVAEAGPTDGPLVILLHGFPDLWQGWRQQIEPLVSAGYRVLLPNQRGYGRSDKPRGVSAYDLDALAADVLALAESEGHSVFQLVGHDWGGIVAFWTAACSPQCVEQLAILNAPHPGIVRRYMLTHPTQAIKSWYVALFQIPWLPERLLSANGFSRLFGSLESTSSPGTFDDDDREYLLVGWSQPGALRAMLHYYRALVRRSDKSCAKRVTVPTLILFSQNDPTEEPGLASVSLKLCDDAEVIWFSHARHWLQREEAERVNESLLVFLKGPR